MESLNQYINHSKASCYNLDDSCDIASILKGTGNAKSNEEVDCQMLIHIPFTEQVKIKSISFSSSPKNDEESGPKTIKIFKNNSNLSFMDAESDKPEQELNLEEGSLDGSDIKLRFVKFQNVCSLEIFVEDNQSDSDVTILNQIVIKGQPIAGFNMNNLKKMG